MKEGLKGHVVVEMSDLDNEPLVKLVGGDLIETVVAHDVIGRLMIQCALQPGLAQVMLVSILVEIHHNPSSSELLGSRHSFQFNLIKLGSSTANILIHLITTHKFLAKTPSGHICSQCCFNLYESDNIPPGPDCLMLMFQTYLLLYTCIPDRGRYTHVMLLCSSFCISNRTHLHDAIGFVSLTSVIHAFPSMLGKLESNM